MSSLVTPQELDKQLRDYPAYVLTVAAKNSLELLNEYIHIVFGYHLARMPKETEILMLKKVVHAIAYPEEQEVTSAFWT